MEDVKIWHVFATKSVGQKSCQIFAVKFEITIFRKLTVIIQESKNFNEFSKEQNFAKILTPLHVNNELRSSHLYESSTNTQNSRDNVSPVNGM
jgi:hypothetical protein